MDDAQTLADELLKTFPRFFQDPKEAAAVASRFGVHEWDEGAELFSYGKDSDRMHFVPRGALTITLEDPSSGDATTSVLLAGGGDGTFVGEFGLLRPGRVSATVRTSTPLRTLELSNADLVQMLTSNDRTEARAATHLVSALCVLVADRLRRSSAGYFSEGPGAGAVFQSAIAALHGDEESPFEGLGELPPSLDTHWSPSSEERKHLDARALEVLDGVPELEPLGANMRQMLSRMVMLQRGQPGDLAIAGHSNAHGVYLVLEGAVRVQVHPQPGEEPVDFRVDRTLGPGQVFGIVSYALSCPPTAEITVAEENTVLAVFTESQVNELARLGDAGMPVGALFRHWMAGQLADDARALNDRILADFRARSADNAG